MEQAEISRKVQARFGERIVSAGSFAGQHWVIVRPADLVEVLHFLRDDPELDMNLLTDVGGVDYQGFPDEPDWRFEIAYQLQSLKQNYRFRVKCAVTDDTVRVPSVWQSWRTANWMEREIFDQFGIGFDGHPNLRRILNHDDFEGHPLRKDYPINKRQKLARPAEHLLTDDPEWA